ncbi:MAG TPA: hypothetical protein DCR14_05295 [Acidimicrobiaceae bacterium]|nr:hypothetical protein [Acidimicrobiaceae bacterium]
MAQARISRDDLESKFKEVQDGLQGKLDDKKQSLVAIGAGVGVVLLLLFFLLGKRSGKKKTTLVEIRRV